jgi:hypothetical protein
MSTADMTGRQQHETEPQTMSERDRDDILALSQNDRADAHEDQCKWSDELDDECLYQLSVNHCPLLPCGHGPPLASLAALYRLSHASL